MRVQRILAPNPSPYTGPGTNTWVMVDQDRCLIVDPGPVIASHRTAIHAAVEGLTPLGVLVTHTHPDHAPLANPLAAEFEVPAYGHAPGPEFSPDIRLADGDTIWLGSHAVTVLHTPGHAEDHLCFRWREVLFTGDHIMGGSTVMVEDMGAYLSSLRRLETMTFARLHPGHGDTIDDPAGTIRSYLAHRLEREREVLAAVDSGAATVGAVVEKVYSEVDPQLHPLAAFSVEAHLLKLAEEGIVTLGATPADRWDRAVAPTGVIR
ncbi:MAG TPA: MBL fold metallo-hydrolase [Acidimicrobiia bacterium]|nr:MBL fold metallo-hydrolase [Acidimicrobiia bacterium]